MKRLNELFDKPVAYKRTENTNERKRYTFSIEGKSYIVQIAHDDTDDSNDAWEVMFFLIGSFNNAPSGTEISGSGSEIKVFSTVVSIIKTFVKSEKPEVIYFSAKEKSRQSLYAAMVRKLGKGYSNAKYTWQGELIFRLTRK